MQIEWFQVLAAFIAGVLLSAVAKGALSSAKSKL
jgi:hypothetical protein